MFADVCRVGQAKIVPNLALLENMVSIVLNPASVLMVKNVERMMVIVTASRDQWVHVVKKVSFLSECILKIIDALE